MTDIVLDAEPAKVIDCRTFNDGGSSGVFLVSLTSSSDAKPGPNETHKVVKPTATFPPPPPSSSHASPVVLPPPPPALPATKSSGRRYVVVKGSSAIVGELFADKLYTLFNLARVPRSRLLKWPDDDHWTRLRACMMKKAVNTDVRDSIEKQLNRAQYVVMEFIDSCCTFNNLCIKYTAPADIKRVLTKIAFQIGQVIAMDVLINNWDRFACDIWDHEGNGGNIMIRNDVLICIDQVVCCVNNNSYYDKVDSFLRSLVKYSEYEAASNVLEACLKYMPPESPFNGLLKFITNHTGIVPDMQFHRDVIRGCRDGVSCISRISRVDIGNIYDGIKSCVTQAQDWADVWANGVKSIRLDFIYTILDKYALASAEMSKAVAMTTRDVIKLYRPIKSHDNVRIVCCQTETIIDTVEVTKSCLSTVSNVNFLVLPEYALGVKSHVIAVDKKRNPVLHEISRLAIEYKCYIIPGTCIEHDGPRCYNTAIMIGPSGDIVLKYRKRSLVGSENSSVSAGQSPGIADTPFGRVAVLTCHDLEQSAYINELMDIGGVRYLFSPSELTSVESITSPRTAINTSTEKHMAMCRAHHCTVIRVDYVHGHGMGNTFIVTPSSRYLSDPLVPGVLLADVNMSYDNVLTGSFPCHRFRSLPQQNYGSFVTVRRGVVKHGCVGMEVAPGVYCDGDDVHVCSVPVVCDDTWKYSVNTVTHHEKSLVMVNRITSILVIHDTLCLVGDDAGVVSIVMIIDDELLLLNSFSVFTGPIDRMVEHADMQIMISGDQYAVVTWQQNGAETSLRALFIDGPLY